MVGFERHLALNRAKIQNQDLQLIILELSNFFISNWFERLPSSNACNKLYDYNYICFTYADF